MPIQFPINPINGQTYVYNNTAYIYNNPPGVWSILQQLKKEELANIAVVSDTQPVNPENGSFWYNVDTGTLNIYISGVYLQVTNNMTTQIDHSLIDIVAGEGLTGGGDITASRTIAVDIDSLTLDGSPDGSADFIMTYDTSTGEHKKVLINNLPGGGGGGGGGGVSDHGGLSGLADDDHTQYSLADGTRWTTTPTASRAVISNGSGVLVASTITSTQLGYLGSVTSDIQTQINSKADTAHNHDHDALTNFVANEHIDHTSVTLTAGVGLSGGGDISSNRTFNLDFNSLTTENSVDSASDVITFYDDSAGAYRKTTVANLGLGGGGGLSNAYATMTDGSTPASASGSDTFKFRTANGLLSIATQSNDATHGDNVLFTLNEGSINHDNLTGFVGNEHIDHTSVTLTAGEGLTGGGDISSNRTFDLDVNGLTADATPDGAADYVLTYDASASGHKKVLLDNLPGGGGGTTTFTGLTDTPANFSGQANKFVAVNAGATALEFVDAPAGGGSSDHGTLTGLADDDHTQYSLADGSRWTTTPTINRAVISDGSGDLVVSTVTSTELGFLSGVSSNVQTQIDGKANTSHTHATTDITSGTFADARISSSSVTQHEGDIDHDALTNFVANEHIDHTSVTLTAGEGLTGGGDISSSRTFDLDVNGLTADATPDGAADYIVTYDGSAGNHKKVLLEDLPISVSASIPTGSTLPVSPALGDTFIHTPTGRSWLMQYNGTDWIAVRSFGTSTIYASNDANGSTDWEDGGTIGSPLKVTFITDNLPGVRGGDITINLANVSYNGDVDPIHIPSGLSGAGAIYYIGSTTEVVASTTFSSGSSPYQSLTMSGAVGGGSPGDVLVYNSGTNPGTPEIFNPNSSVGVSADEWCIVSVSGSTIEVGGGLSSITDPDGTTNFKILSRDSVYTLENNSDISIGSKQVVIKYLTFQLSDTMDGNYVLPDNNTTVLLIGCEFYIPATTSSYFDGLRDCALVGCFLNGQDAPSSNKFNLTSGGFKTMTRTYLEFTEVFSGGRGLSSWSSPTGGVNLWVSNYFNNLADGRIGHFDFSAKVRFNIAGVSNLKNFLALGGNTNYGFEVRRGSGVIALNDANFTKVGTTAALSSIDSATFGYE